MPLDHYVSQVHLKNFYSAKLGELMYAIRKHDLKAFTPNSESVCRIENNSTNSYLRDDRLIEEFLKGIEPKYNAAIEKIKANDIDKECIYVISGFIAYVYTCSPGGMRIFSEPLRAAVESTTRILDSKEVFPEPPSELGGSNLTELLKNGTLQIEIDPKYPQAISILLILNNTSTFGNSKWDVLVNPFENNPFLTSDFPVAIERTNDLRLINKIVPLTPNLAIRIRPNLLVDPKRIDFSFSNFGVTIKKLSRQEVLNINRLIVRCAETTVFFSEDYEWIPKFVKKNSHFRVEPRTIEIPQGNGTFLLSTQEVRKVTP